MHLKTKYIITKNNEIVVFSELLQHSVFEFFEPISAGFISFGINEKGNFSCFCYGKSISLGIESRPEDTDIAKIQLNMQD